jgi:hypothetical protein
MVATDKLRIKEGVTGYNTLGWETELIILGAISSGCRGKNWPA